MDHEVREKQRELNELLELRIHTLTRSISQLESQLKEASQRYQILKEDYTFNLDLLEAKDGEISRLDSLLQDTNDEKNIIHGKLKAVLMKVEALEERETSTKAKIVSEKSHTKGLVLELMEELQNMRLKMQEESGIKEREILTLREDNKSLIRLREESLESQRRDLTHTFELLATQTEKAYHDREQRLAEQVGSLEAVFRQLRAENASMKAQLLETARRRDAAESEAVASDDRLRRLQWRLDDQLLQREQQEDALKRQLLSKSLELAKALEGTEATNTHHLHEINKLESEVARYKEYQTSLEETMRVNAVSHQTQLKSVQEDLQSSIARERSLEAGLKSLRVAHASVLDKFSSLETELTGSVMQRDNLRLECESLQKELARVQSEHQLLLQTTEAHQQRTQAQLEVRISDLNVSVGDLQRELQVRIADSNDLRVRYGDELHSLENEVRRLVDALEVSEIARGEEAQKCKDACCEREILRLRLDAASSNSNTIGRGYSRGHAEMGSPTFSEDFGPISLPTSPQQKSTARASLELRSQALSDLRISTGSESPLAAPVLARVRELETENEELRDVVRQMRLDIESLRNAPKKEESAPSDVADRRSADERVASLEKRLQMTVNEVARLRLDRQKLMDVGNELRAKLNRLTDQDALAEPQPTPQAAQIQNPPLLAEVPPSSNLDVAAAAAPDTVLDGYLFGAPVRNTARTTVSQLQALERIKKSQKLVSHQRAPRRVLNYAITNNNDTEQ